MLNTTLSLFRTVVTRITKNPWSRSPNNHLWYNPALGELRTLLDPQGWALHRIKYLCHLFHVQDFKSFSSLKEQLSLSPHYIFYYYQLRHVVQAQFSSLVNPVYITPLEKMLCRLDPTKLISHYYSALMTDSNRRFATAQTR